MTETKTVEVTRWLADAVELIRECRLADAHAARTGDELRWDEAFHELCKFERQAKPILGRLTSQSLSTDEEVRKRIEILCLTMMSGDYVVSKRADDFAAEIMALQSKDTPSHGG